MIRMRVRVMSEKRRRPRSDSKGVSIYPANVEVFDEYIKRAASPPVLDHMVTDAQLSEHVRRNIRDTQHLASIIAKVDTMLLKGIGKYAPIAPGAEDKFLLSNIASALTYIMQGELATLTAVVQSAKNEIEKIRVFRNAAGTLTEMLMLAPQIVAYEVHGLLGLKHPGIYDRLSRITVGVDVAKSNEPINVPYPHVQPQSPENEEEQYNG